MLGELGYTLYHANLSLPMSGMHLSVPLFETNMVVSITNIEQICGND
jgi:hypothetical protein